MSLSLRLRTLCGLAAGILSLTSPLVRAQIDNNPRTVGVVVWGNFQTTVEEDLVSYHYRVWLESDCTPLTPDGVTHVVSPEKSGEDQPVVDKLELGRLQMEPGKAYNVTMQGDFNTRYLWRQISAAAPSGYYVEMNGMARNRISYSSDEGYMQTLQATIRVLPNSSAPPRPTGTASEIRSGKLNWSISLGALKNGQSAGELCLVDAAFWDDWSALYTPAVLNLHATSDGEVYGLYSPQLSLGRTNDAVIEIAVDSATKYEIRFYSLAQLSTVNNVSSVDGSPHITYIVEKGDTATSLKFTKQFRNNTATDFNAPVTRTEVASLKREGTWPNFTWTTVNWTEDGQTAVAERVETSSGDANGRTQTTYAVRPPGTTTPTVQSSRTFTQHTDWGESVDSLTVGTVDSQQTTYDYYTDTTNVGSLGFPKAMHRPGGGWEAYEYAPIGTSDTDSLGWMGVVIGKYRPFNASPGTASWDKTQGEYTSYNYAIDPFGFPSRLAFAQTKINNVVVSKSETLFTNVPHGQTPNPWQLVKADRRDYRDATNYLSTITCFISEDYSEEFYRNQVHSLQQPNGVKISYAYQRGQWNGTSFELTGNNGLDDLFHVGNGPTWDYDRPISSRTAVITGTASTGTLYTTYDGYDIDDLYLVEGKSTLAVTIRNERAKVVRQETRIWHNGAWDSTPISSVDYTYDFLGRLRGTVANNGATHTYEYGSAYGGALLTSETDEAGVTRTYTYDAADRVRTVTRAAAGSIAALTTQYTYDATGKVLTETVGPGTSNPIVTGHTYDDAGRLRSDTPAGLGATTYTYNVAARTQTATAPDGGTTVAAAQLDGQPASVTGTAVVAQYFSYGVESDGRRWTQANLGTSSSSRWQKSWIDLQGRSSSATRPGFTGQPDFTETNDYNTTSGLLIKHTEPGSSGGTLVTRYEYDEMGQVKRTGLDLADDGLTTASEDRITDSVDVCDYVNGAWWRRQETYGYPYHNVSGHANDEQKKLSTVLTRLTGFAANVLAEVQTIDAEGNTSTTTTSVDRSSATATTTMTRSGFSGTTTQVSVAGLPTSSTGNDNLQTRLEYDSLSRLVHTIDSRSNTSTTAYYPGTALVQSVTDAADNVVRTVGYDTSGRIASTRDAANQYTYFAHNRRGQIIRQWGGATYPVSYAYNSYGERVAQRTFRIPETNFANATWPLDDDGADSLNPDSNSWTVGDKTTWSYDGPSGLLSSKTDALNRTVNFTYNARGQTYQTTSPRNVVATYAYNATGDVESKSYSDGTTTVGYTYTRLGQLASASDVTGTRDFVYDPAKPWRLSAEALPSFYGSRVVTSLYESSDVVGRPQGFQLGASAGSNAELEQAWSYTTGGRFDTLATKRSSNVQIRTFQYGYLSNSPFVNAVSVVGGSFSVGYTYEPKRDLVTAVDSKWDAASRTRYDYTYNALRQRRTAKQAGDLFTAAGDFGGSTYYRYVYNARGEVTEAVDYYGEDVESTSSPQLIDRRFGFDYDNIGNRRNGTRSLGTSVSDEFHANALNQYSSRQNEVTYTAGTALANSSIAVTGGTAAATIGRAGKYWGAEIVLDNAAGPVKTDLTVKAALAGSPSLVRTENRTAYLAQALQQFGYDEDGNLTSDGIWTYVYDGENRLVSMITTSVAVSAGFPDRTLEFKYDYLGRRVQKRSINVTANTDTTTRYLYDGWNLVAEYSVSSSSSLTLTRSYTWGLDLAGSPTAAGGVGALVQLTDHATGTSYFPTYDGNGNVASLLRANDGAVAARYEYSPFGELLRIQGSYGQANPFRFSTKYTDDESGLVYYGHRFYSPSLGRFVNRDPIEEAGGLNLYGFCGNDAIGGWDLLGMNPTVTTIKDNNGNDLTVSYDPDKGAQGGHTRDGSSILWVPGMSAPEIVPGIVELPPFVTTASKLDTSLLGITRQLYNWSGQPTTPETQVRNQPNSSKPTTSANQQGAPRNAFQPTSVWSDRLDAWVSIGPGGRSTQSIHNRKLFYEERALQTRATLFAWTGFGINTVVTAMSFNPEALLAQIALMRSLAMGARGLLLEAGEGIAMGEGGFGLVADGPSLGGGTIFTHFTNVAGIEGITGVSADSLEVGALKSVEKLRFGMGSNPFLAAEPGSIFVTDLGADATAGELNQIGVFGAKQEFGIQFSQETLLNNNVRALMSKESIFTIPGGTEMNGTFIIFRR